MRSCRILRTAVLGTALAGLLAPGAAVAKPSPAELSQQLNTASQQLEAVIEQYDATQVRLTASEARRATLVAEMAPVQARMDELESRIGRYSASLYEHLDGSPVTALFEAASPRSLLDELTMLDHLSWLARREVDDLRTIARQHQQQQDQLDGILAQQRVQRADLAVKRAQIEARIAQLARLRYTLYGARMPVTPRDRYIPPYLPGPAGVAVRFAYAQLGHPYRWGGDGPGSYDCSGLTMAAWRAAGVTLPHNAAMQWATVAHVARTDLAPGDLVFYYDDLHHVGIYIGADRIIHAPTVGQDVEIAPIDQAPIYGFGRPLG